MTPKSVSKLTFYFWTLIFHSLCLSGLIWQVTQISINFFKYEVLKDINVIMPEESRKKEKVAYVCFKNYEIIDKFKLRWELRDSYNMSGDEISTTFRKPQFLKLTVNGLSLKSRFKVTKMQHVVIEGGTFRQDLGASEFIISDKYCYKIDIVASKVPLNIDKKKILDNVSSYDIEVSRPGIPFDMKKLITVVPERYKEKRNSRINIKSLSYSIYKLQHPYTDDCYDYKILGFTDRLDAIADCITAQAPKFFRNPNYVSSTKVFNRSTYGSSSSEIMLDNGWDHDECYDNNYRLDCTKHHYLTHVAIPISEPSITTENETHLYIEDDTDASYDVISKPRIDDIDYVTYILGALGSWIGFSFVGINPIPYFIKIQGNEVAPDNLNDERDDRIKKLENASVQSKNESIQLRHESMLMKQHIISVEREMKESLRNTAELRHSYDQFKHVMFHRIQNIPE